MPFRHWRNWLRLAKNTPGRNWKLDDPISNFSQRRVGMEFVLVERRFEQTVTFQDIQKQEQRGSWCLDTYHVRFLKTFLSRDQRRMLCLYEAPDAESVRQAEAQAGVPFECAWTCH